MVKMIMTVMTLSVVMATSLAAKTLTYEATSAQSNAWWKDNQSIRIADLPLDPKTGLDRRWHFEPGAIFRLIEEADGLSARVTGKILSQSVSEAGFELDFRYDDDLSAYGRPSFKDEQGSAAIQARANDNFYLNMISGTLRGTGALEGISFAASSMPVPTPGTFATQVGTGSNNKNEKFGLANWFFINRAGNCANGQFDLCALLGSQGDMNIDLTPVPLPSTLWMMIAGVAGLGTLRRKSL